MSAQSSPNDRLRIVLLGYLVRGGVGGMVWNCLNYMLGLLDLGHDVYFFEDSGDTPWSCYDPQRETTDADPTFGLEFAARTMGKLGAGDRWAYYDAHTSQWRGACADRAFDICKSADLVLNLLCLDPLRPWFMETPARAMVDTDPVFRQIRNLTDETAAVMARQHNVFFSYGVNIARGTSSTPDDGMPWRATRPPVFLEAWPAAPPQIDGAYTTVMLWQSYKAAEYDGERYGMKSESFQPYFDLPRRTSSSLELVVGGPDVPREMLLEKGWKLSNPHEVTLDPWVYQSYIQASKAEFSVAKQGYVIGRSGWFSERSVSYLASGRPVLVQDTAFSTWLPAGSGVLTFASPAEALAGIEEINARHAHHCGAARAMAEEYFDSRKVLTELIESVFASA